MTSVVGDVPRLPGGLAAELRRQADRCRQASPLYGELLDRAAEDAEHGGITAKLLRAYADEPLTTVPGLRLMAAVHQLVLTGKAPRLARYYQTAGGQGRPDRAAAWPAFQDTLATHERDIAALLRAPVQTNEPGRAAALYGGMLTVASRTRRAIRLLEIGASAGLNLRADHFAYRVDGSVLGDPGSPVVLDDPWRGHPPAAPDATVRVVSRRGCDPNPLDPADPAVRLRLESLVWADAHRLTRLRAAIDLAGRIPAAVDRAGAGDWLAARLAGPPSGTATLVWHSIVRQYVPAPEWRRVGDILSAAGAAATPEAPLAHLGLEPDVAPDGRYTFHLSMTLWPGGRTETLATVAAHGIPTCWTMDP